MHNAIKLSKEQKERIVENVQAYFLDERSEDMSQLAAELLVDFMLKQLGPCVYNKAISDVRAVMNEMHARVDDELYALEKPIERR